MNAAGRKPSLRAEAENPATPPRRLRELVRRGHGKAVAANPNAPVNLLLKLAPRHFEAFLANPVLPLLLLEDPGFCLKIPVTALRRLLRNGQLPATFLQTLTRHPDAEVRGAAKLHVAAPVAADTMAELDAALHALPVRSGSLPTMLRLDLLPLWLLEPLGGAANSEFRREVLAALERRRDESSRALWRLLERGGLRPRDPDTWTGMASNLTAGEMERLARSGPMARWQAAQHPLTPPAMLQRLAGDVSARVALAVLRNRSTPEATLWAYAGSPDERCRLQIVRNPACPPRLLEQLSHDRSTKVRVLVARHRAADDATLSRLAGDPDKTVVLAVLGNRRTGPAILEALSHSADVSIRCAVARHRCTPLSVTERLSEDASVGVRKALASQGNVTREMFIRLCCDTNDSVAQDARFRRKSVSDRYRRGLYNLPKSPDELAALLHDWIPHPPASPEPPRPLPLWKPRRTYWRQRPTHEEYERSRRAYESDGTDDELAEFARDPQAEVREGVARNARTPAEMLHQLTSDSCQRVRECVAFNSATPSEALRQLSTDVAPRVRRFAAYHKNCPRDVLEALSLSTDPEVRGAVAHNQGTPIESLRRLATDAGCHANLARNPKVPADVLVELWTSAKADCRESLAGNPSLPVALLLEIAALAGDALRAIVAAHPNLPTPVAEQFANDPIPAVRRAVATRGDLSEDILRRLAAESTPGMSKVLAHNPRTPTDILAGYATHPESDVRHTVVYNPSTPTAALLVLAEDPAMLMHLRHRPDGPPELRARLDAALKPEERVQDLLKDPVANLEKLKAIALDGTDNERSTLRYSDVTPEAVLMVITRLPKADDRRHLAYNRRLPPAVAIALAHDEDPVTRAEVAKRHRLPEEILSKLLGDTALPEYARRWMRTSLAERLDTPAAVLLRIAREETARVLSGGRIRSRFASLGRDDAVLAAVAKRTEVPISIFEPALSITYPPLQAALLRRPDLPPEWRTRIEDVTLTAAVRGVSRLARLAALTHPRIPRADLLSFAKEGGWLERYAATQNPAAPVEALSALAVDANVLVRDAAQKKLAEAQRSKS